MKTQRHIVAVLAATFFVGWFSHLVAQGNASNGKATLTAVQQAELQRGHANPSQNNAAGTADMPPVPLSETIAENGGLIMEQQPQVEAPAKFTLEVQGLVGSSSERIAISYFMEASGLSSEDGTQFARISGDTRATFLQRLHAFANLEHITGFVLEESQDRASLTTSGLTMEMFLNLLKSTVEDK